MNRTRNLRTDYDSTLQRGIWTFHLHLTSPKSRRRGLSSNAQPCGPDFPYVDGPSLQGVLQYFDPLIRSLAPIYAEAGFVSLLSSSTSSPESAVGPRTCSQRALSFSRPWLA